MAGVKNRGQFVFVDHLVDGPSHLVVRVIALHRGMKFETANTLFFDESLGFSSTHLALVRVDAGKGDHHVAVVTCGFGNFFVGNAPPAHVRLSVNGEHDQTYIALAVIGHGFFNGGAALRAKVFVCSAVVFLAIVVKRVPAAHLGVGVDVNGNQVGMVHGRIRSFPSTITIRKTLHES